MTLRTLNYGNYGIFLIMGNAGFCPSTVVQGLGLRDLKHFGSEGRNRSVEGHRCMVVEGP